MHFLVKINPHVSVDLGIFEEDSNLILNNYAIAFKSSSASFLLYYKDIKLTAVNLLFLRAEDFQIVSQIPLEFLNNLSFQDYYLFKRASENSFKIKSTPSLYSDLQYYRIESVDNFLKEFS